PDLDQSELDGHHDDNTEPDGVKAQRHDDRINDRHHQDDHRHGIQKATHDDEQGPDQSQGSVGPEAEIDQHLRQLLRHLGDGQEIAEEDSADQDRIDRDGGAQRLHQTVQQGLERQAPTDETDQRRQHRADSGGFGGGGDAEIDRDDHGDKQQQHGPDTAHRGGGLAPPEAFTGRKMPAVPEAHGGQIHEHGQDAGHDAGDEERPDILLGDVAVDGQDNGWRDQNAQRAPGRDDARRDVVAVASAFHFRIGDVGHGGGGSHRGSADC